MNHPDPPEEFQKSHPTQIRPYGLESSGTGWAVLVEAQNLIRRFRVSNLPSKTAALPHGVSPTTMEVTKRLSNGSRRRA
jgi:hypothetical protein